MRKPILTLSALLLTSATAVFGQASANLAAGKTQPSPLAPGEIVAKAPKADWTAIAASDLLVMDLAPPARGPGQASAQGKPRRVVIQLMPPPFSQGWIGNIRKLTAARFWDGTAINRVQDNYVVQWGDPNAEDAKKAKKLPADLVTVPESDYSAVGTFGNLRSYRTPLLEMTLADFPYKTQDPYAQSFAFLEGLPFGYHIIKEIGVIFPEKLAEFWPIHCYGMVGVGRDLSPNTGTGAELYTVIGHAPRHLDRNIALVGRVIEGIEHLSSLPRGKGPLGFYDLKQGDRRVPIRAIRLGSEVKGLPAYEYLSTKSGSFAQYADARANRRDAFFIRPAGGADICNIPVPVRRAM